MARAIVIGTGAGGLAAAIGLAEQGHEVVALEAAKQLGGYLNPFARKHYLFDPGVHYMGQLGPGETTALTLERLGLDPQALFCPMDPDCVDMIRFPGLEVRIPKGLSRYQARLKEHFPEDRKDIDKLFGALRRFNRVTNFLMQKNLRKRKLSDVAAATGFSFAAKWLERSYAELLDHYTSNPQLKAVLAGQGGDYGLPPSRTPAVLGVGLLLHYAEGGWFPRGGSGDFRDALVARGQSMGATYRRRAPVEKIHVDGSKVTGVTLASGERLEADLIVSAIDPTITLGRLLPEGLLSPRLQAKVDNTEASVASLCVFLGMKRDLEAHGLGAFNVWDYPSWDIEGLYARLKAGERPEEQFFFLSPNSLKDDTGTMTPPGGSTLEVITFSAHETFQRWAGERSFKRGPEYEAVKEEIADALLAGVDARWPGLIGDVEVKAVASPVTNTHYTGAVDGGAYGPASTLEQFGRKAYRTRTPIEGLYLAGAGVHGGGVAPCLMSGISAARAALKDRATAVAAGAPSGA